jgi:hypothetical protein
MRRRTRSTALALPFSILCLFSACVPNDGSSQGVAEVFVDKHYVQIDPAAAEPFCVGLALAKVKEVRKLTDGLVIDEGTNKPTVRYKILEAQEEGDHGTYVFEGTIYVEGDDAFSRRWIVSTRKDGAKWKVSNFTEEYD